MGVSVLSVRQYANREGITICTAYRRVWQGQVAAEQVMGRWLVTPEKKKESESAARPVALEQLVASVAR